MRLMRRAARLARRRGRMAGLALVAAAVLLPLLLLRGSTRGAWTLPAPADARPAEPSSA
jgi:hypothetical protein